MVRYTQLEDHHLYPLAGQYFSYRLGEIPIEFWEKMIEEKDPAHIKDPWDKMQAVNDLGAYRGLLAYARKRIKEYYKKPPRKDVSKGRIGITNGKITRFIYPGDPIPDGFRKGAHWTATNNWTTEQKKKISEGLKKYYATEEGKEMAKIINKKSFMKKHTKIYYQFFDYDLFHFIPDELTGTKAVDIHHIEARGMGGSNQKDEIENMMALSRESHLVYGDKKQYKEFLKEAHQHFIANGTPYIEVNPHHEAFDALLKYEKFKKLITWKRKQIKKG